MYRPARVALVLLAAATVAAAVSACEPAPAADKHPSWITRSYYMGNGSGEPARNLGCLNGDKQGRMTLFFGAPTTVSGTYGATLWGAPNRTTGQIAATVREFARGYVFCRQSSSYRLLIGVGTSNSSIDSKSDQWVYGHGRAWATMVRDLSAWASQTYPGHVRIYGAWDAEPSWSTYERADRWMQGYDSEPGRRALHANFSADGCPRDSTANGPCNNGWRQENVWQLAWRYDPSLPMPQIYATSGVNARQWQQIDLYGTIAHGDGMVFWGTLSQHAACGQVGGCQGTDNTPQQAHDHLLWQLNTHPATAQPTIETATDMHWHR
jgi:hypothetical protein